MNSTEEKLLTVQQIADYLHVFVQTVYRWSSEGQIPCFKISKRMVRFDLKKVKKWLATREQKGRRTRRIPIE